MKPTLKRLHEHLSSPLGWLAISILMLLLTIFLSVSAQARVISYAPLTDRSALATYHHRGTRHFPVVETVRGSYEIVLHDSTGEEAPRVLIPPQRKNAKPSWMATWEDDRGVPALLIVYGAFPSGNPIMTGAYFSNDGGHTWTLTALPRSTFIDVRDEYVDNGGPFTRGRFMPVRIGNRDFPFVVYDTAGAVWRVDASGRAAKWLDAESRYGRIALIASDITGTLHLVRNGDGTSLIAGFDGQRFRIPSPELDLATGWIAPDGTVYLETSNPKLLYTPTHDEAHALWMYRHGEWQKIFEPSPGNPAFAIPAHDYAGAWIVERFLRFTDLNRHTPERGLETIWSDRSAPAIEALHTGRSGRTLLIQSNRPRPNRVTAVRDPLLALWHVGEPPPEEADELYVVEWNNRGFLHLDVDRAEAGEAFVFTSGFDSFTNPIVTSSSAGGAGDVQRDWGVVHGSLRQQLVLPGIEKTDVILHNPDALAQNVELRLVDGTGSTTRSVALAPNEIRRVRDVLRTLFDRGGSGTLFLTPERSINATSLTYGYAMPAADVHTAASPRFPAIFAETRPDPAHRSSVVLVDATGHGAEVSLSGALNATRVIPPGGQIEVKTAASGGLTVRPTRGFVIAAAFAIDDQSGDAMWIGPGGTAGWLPAISATRTDLHFYNPTVDHRQAHLFVQPWTSDVERRTSITLPPHASVKHVEAYHTLFGERTGPAHLYFFNGVRMLARHYNLAPNGGAYGHIVPPFTRLQTAAFGESIEILGVIANSGTRTNLGILEINEPSASAGQPLPLARVEIIDSRGQTVDSFPVTMPSGNGYLITDLFATRKLTAITGPVLIRVSPIRGLIAAYATVIDTTTKDSVYLAPYLARRIVSPLIVSE